jgi:hypothetical protein
MKRSKPKKHPADRESQLRFFPNDPPRSADSIDADVVSAATVGPHARLPPEINKTLRVAADEVSGKNAGYSEWDSYLDRTASWEVTATASDLEQQKDDNKFIADLVRQAAEAGFWVAIKRYAEHLRSSAEAMAFINARTAGIDKGHATQAKRSSELHCRIREKWAAMEAAGEKVTNDTVAAAIRADGVQCSRSTVIRAFKEKPSTALAKRTRRLRR